MHKASTPAVPAAEVNLARDRPTRAASEAPGHTGRLGNDGDAATFWSAQGAQAGTWWQVDLENFYVVSKIRVNFGFPGRYRYKIEISDDGARWATAVAQTQTAGMEQVRNDSCVPGSSGRFLRITFTGLPPGKAPSLAEMEVHGAARPGNKP